MKALFCILAPWALAVGALAASGPAQEAAKPGAASDSSIPAQKQTFFYHYEWTRGAILTAPEWQRGISIDARRDELPSALSGEEWREIDRNYVLASSATHAVLRVIAAPHPIIPGHSGGQP